MKENTQRIIIGSVLIFLGLGGLVGMEIMGIPFDPLFIFTMFLVAILGVLVLFKTIDPFYKETGVV